jgi:hypothetical protein
MTNETHDPRNHDTIATREPTARLVGELVELGTAWARHGLAIGESALKTSANTLDLTARFLARVADGLQRSREPQS